ncbi:hypothetical protein TBK1r_42370 [Stieleria magnilauensis]|uniref:Uncharacterized protein n=1 Tax=Stieleria magnilauensis TaxID=2527963 RepID=A0ABX5XTC0_9BACT|nr:hypothetical protein TBK1r_42370 [Planctomycetes bacterium TBK1r]
MRRSYVKNRLGTGETWSMEKTSQTPPLKKRGGGVPGNRDLLTVDSHAVPALLHP